MEILPVMGSKLVNSIKVMLEKKNVLFEISLENNILNIQLEKSENTILLEKALINKMTLTGLHDSNEITTDLYNSLLQKFEKKYMLLIKSNNNLYVGYDTELKVTLNETESINSEIGLGHQIIADISTIDTKLFEKLNILNVMDLINLNYSKLNRKTYPNLDVLKQTIIIKFIEFAAENSKLNSENISQSQKIPYLRVMLNKNYDYKKELIYTLLLYSFKLMEQVPSYRFITALKETLNNITMTEYNIITSFFGDSEQVFEEAKTVQEAFNFNANFLKPYAFDFVQVEEDVVDTNNKTKGYFLKLSLIVKENLGLYLDEQALETIFENNKIKINSAKLNEFESNIMYNKQYLNLFIKGIDSERSWENYLLKSDLTQSEIVKLIINKLSPDGDFAYKLKDIEKYFHGLLVDSLTTEQKNEKFLELKEIIENHKLLTSDNLAKVLNSYKFYSSVNLFNKTMEQDIEKLILNKVNLETLEKINEKDVDSLVTIYKNIFMEVE